MMFQTLLVILSVLLVPMLCRKIHIPAIVGFILVGMVLGPLGTGLLDETGAVDALGRIGILYILFQAGSEIDRNEMQQYRFSSVLFGLYTFVIPMALGILTGRCLLHADWPVCLLLGAMYGSHTLMTYPIVSRYGIQQNRSVILTVGGTMLAIVLSLLVLAGVRHSAGGNDGNLLVSSAKIALMLGVVLWLIPTVARWFFKRRQDPVENFVFVMCMMVLSAWLGDISGLDAILGAFLCGVSLNKLLPNHSPLMNRITFVGNAVFVSFFLLGVGMLIDVRVFVSGWTVWALAAVMIGTKLVGKWIAATLIQHHLHLNGTERQLVFGLTHATAAGTLAIATIGYQVHILDPSILNAAVLMILVLCTVSSFVTEHAAKQLALQQETKIELEKEHNEWLLVSPDVRTSVQQLTELAAAAQLPNAQALLCAGWKDIKDTIERETKSVVVYRESQPMNTVSRLLVAVPRYAEKEWDFITCFGLIRRLSSELGAKVVFYANTETQKALHKMCNRTGKNLSAQFYEMDDWEDVLMIAKDIRPDDMLVLQSTRRSTASYNTLFEGIPDMLARFFTENSYMVIYPEQQTGGTDMDTFLMDLPQGTRNWDLVTRLWHFFRPQH